MTNAEKAELHVVVLQTLRTKGDLGLTEDGLKNAVRLQGFDLAAPQLQVELRALADKAWIAAWEPELAPKRWRITPLGESKLAEAGL